MPFKHGAIVPAVSIRVHKGYHPSALRLYPSGRCPSHCVKIVDCAAVVIMIACGRHLYARSQPET